MTIDEILEAFAADDAMTDAEAYDLALFEAGE